MNKILQYTLIAFVSFTIVSCSTGKQLSSKKGKAALTEKQEMEYLFHFIEGNKLKTLGYFNDAVANYNKCLVLKPNASAVNYELANVYIFNGDFYKAISYAESAADADEKNVWYQLLYANLLLQNKSWKEAASILERSLEWNPSNLEVKLLLASIYSGTKKDAKKALSIYISIEEEFGFTEQLAFEKEKLYTNLGDKEKALEEIRKLTILDPENPRYYGLYAESLINSGKYIEAENVYETIFILDPDNGLAHISFGEYLLNKGEKEKAMAEFKTGMSNESLSTKPKGNMIVKLETTYSNVLSRAELIELIEIINKVHPNNVQGHAMLADYYIQDGAFEKARIEILLIVEKQKDISQIWDQLLMIDFELKDYSGLYNHSKEAIELFPSYNRFYLLHGIACERIKKYDEGIEMLEMGIDFVVEDDALKSEFYTQIAEIQNRQKKHTKSDASFDKALELNPKNEAVLNNYSYYLSLRGEQLEKALKHIELANLISPSSGTYLDTYAWVLFVMKRYDEALIKIEQALKYGGDKSGVIVEHYGDILFKLNKAEEAKEQWNKALEIDPENKKLQHKIETGKID